MKEVPDTIENAKVYEKFKDYAKAAEIYAELGEYDQAKRLYLLLEQRYPFHKDIKFKLGRVLTYLQEWDEAIIKLQDVSKIGIFAEETLYLLAECFRNKGYVYAAKEMYVELLERNYHYKDARQKLQSLESPGIAGFATAISTSSTSVGNSATGGKILSETMPGIALEDRYSLIEELGRGGMGIVYKAEDTRSHNLVAIKMLPPHLAADDMNRQRFFREAEIAANLHHPHIVTLIEVNPRHNFLVMEYVQGGTLTAWRTSHDTSERDLLTWIGQILDALHTVHQHGIIHRDIKPENILIANQTTAKLTDFGIAHISGATITHTGTHLGTLPYMSPEQILGTDVDARSDIYAVGVVLYELCTGSLPFTGKDASFHHIHTPPRPPKAIRASLSDTLNGIILTCLAKSPEDRYPDAHTLASELAAVAIVERNNRGLS